MLHVYRDILLEKGNMKEENLFFSKRPVRFVLIGVWRKAVLWLYSAASFCHELLGTNSGEPRIYFESGNIWITQACNIQNSWCKL